MASSTATRKRTQRADDVDKALEDEVVLDESGDSGDSAPADPDGENAEAAQSEQEESEEPVPSYGTTTWT